VIYAIKILISAFIIVAVNELSKRSTALAAMLLALPIVSVIAFTWEWTETSDAENIANLSTETFWFVLPTLPMFLLLSWLLRQGYNYYLALAICSVLTAVLFATTQYFVQRSS
jgi:hypothetical protein